MCFIDALPENIGNLSKLRDLDVESNEFKELPRSIVDLDASCRFNCRGNRLQMPPQDIADQGMMAIRRYFDELD